MTLKPLNEQERKSLEEIINLLTKQNSGPDRNAQDKARQKNRQLKNATRSI